MKNFIEVHDKQRGGLTRLININRITEVCDNYIYITAAEIIYIECQETYLQICNKIKSAEKGGEQE